MRVGIGSMGTSIRRLAKYCNLDELGQYLSGVG